MQGGIYIQKTVTEGVRYATVVLDGTECKVKFSAPFRCFEVFNDSGADVTISILQGGGIGDDGVITVHTGTSATLAHMRSDIDTVYITGSGTVQVAAKNSGEAVFKSKAKGGENLKSGVIELYGTISDYTTDEINETEE